VLPCLLGWTSGSAADELLAVDAETGTEDRNAAVLGKACRLALVLDDRRRIGDLAATFFADALSSDVTVGRGC